MPGPPKQARALFTTVMNHCQDMILPKVLWRRSGAPLRADFWSLVDTREEFWSRMESQTDSPMPPDSRLDSPMRADSPSPPAPRPGTPKHAQSSFPSSYEVCGSQPSSTSSSSSSSDSLPLTRIEPYAPTDVKFSPPIALTGKWSTLYDLRLDNTQIGSCVDEEETYEDKDCKLGRHGFEISPSKRDADDMDTSVESLLPVVSFEESIQARLAQLRSQTTDFEEIRHFRHYCDRTSILEATIKHSCVLLKAPPGHGKTTALSMIEQFYDILQKDDFCRIFKGTAIGCHLILHEECDHHSRSLVLKLDFGNLDLLRTDFNMNAEINRMLEDFVDRYRSLIPQLSDSARSEFVDEESAAETLRNIMYNLELSSELAVCIDNYDTPFLLLEDVSREKFDEIRNPIAEFFDMLVFLGGEPFIPLIVLAGSEHDLGFFAGPLSEMAHNIDGSINPDYLLGLSEHDVDATAWRLNHDFPSLGLDDSGQEYLDSEEGQEKWKSVGRYYGFSFREMLDYFAEKVEEATRSTQDVGDTGDTMSRMVI